jgi:hypothetical protein
LAACRDIGVLRFLDRTATEAAIYPADPPTELIGLGRSDPSANSSLGAGEGLGGDSRPRNDWGLRNRNLRRHASVTEATILNF